MGVLDTLMRADIAGRQSFTQGLDKLAIAIKAKRFKDLGRKLVDSGDYSPEGLQIFAQENDVDLLTMQQLVQMVQMFKQEAPKRQFQKDIKMGEEFVSGYVSPEKGLEVLARGPRETELAREKFGLAERKAISAEDIARQRLGIRRKELGLKEKEFKLKKTVTPQMEKDIMSSIMRSFKVSDLDSIDDDLRDKIYETSDRAANLMRQGLTRNKAALQAYREIKQKYKLREEDEETVRTLEELPAPDFAGWGDNVDETKEKINQALEYSDPELIVDELVEKGWNMEQIKKYFRTELREGFEDIPVKEPKIEKKTLTNDIARQLLRDVGWDGITTPTAEEKAKARELAKKRGYK